MKSKFMQTTLFVVGLMGLAVTHQASATGTTVTTSTSGTTLSSGTGTTTSTVTTISGSSMTSVTQIPFYCGPNGVGGANTGINGTGGCAGSCNVNMWADQGWCKPCPAGTTSTGNDIKSGVSACKPILTTVTAPVTTTTTTSVVDSQAQIANLQARVAALEALINAKFPGALPPPPK